MRKRLIATISLLLALASAGTAWPADATTTHGRKPLQNKGARPEPKPPRAQTTVDSCTMAVPPTRATVEAEIANAADFCELVSQALAVDVFQAPVLVTPGLLWHYADATLSCRLRYGNTPYLMTIRNSPAACRWLSHLAPNWHLEAPPREQRPGVSTLRGHERRATLEPRMREETT